MSPPAIFTPVVAKDGQIFVDGDSIDNLPVDVVKAMGADIVIAIYLETFSIQSESGEIPVQHGRTNGNTQYSTKNAPVLTG